MSIIIRKVISDDSHNVETAPLVGAEEALRWALYERDESGLDQHLEDVATLSEAVQRRSELAAQNAAPTAGKDRIHRLVLANISAAQLADDLAALGIDGTAVDGTGFTSQWGTEPAALAIIAGTPTDRVAAAAWNLAQRYGESAAYVDDGEDAFLVHKDGTTEALA